MLNDYFCGIIQLSEAGGFFKKKVRIFVRKWQFAHLIAVERPKRLSDLVDGLEKNREYQQLKEDY